MPPAGPDGGGEAVAAGSGNAGSRDRPRNRENDMKALLNWLRGSTRTANPTRPSRLGLEQLDARVVPSVTAPSDPHYVATLGQMRYFTADDGVHGTELWKTDGSVAGTALVKDINPGRDGSSLVYLTTLNGTMYFSADDGVHGSELWK